MADPLPPAWIDIDPSTPPDDGWYHVRWCWNSGEDHVVQVVDGYVRRGTLLSRHLDVSWADLYESNTRQMWAEPIAMPPDVPYYATSDGEKFE